MSNQEAERKLGRLSKDQKLAIDSLARILKKDKELLLENADLFSECGFYTSRVFECISQLDDSQLVSAVISLEYIALSKQGDRNIKDVVEAS